MGVLTALSLPGPLVPAAEGLIFLVLLLWAQWEYESRRKDSPAFRQHVEYIQGFARQARYTGLFMEVRRVGDVEINRPINMTTPNARDFRAHYPEVAHEIDEWNQVTIGIDEASARYIGPTHTTAEGASQDRTSNGLQQLLQSFGQGDLDLSRVEWRVQGAGLEASWSRNTFGEPVWQTIIGRPVPGVIATGITDNRFTAEDLQRVGDAIDAFPRNPYVRDWRERVRAVRRLRPKLVDGLEHAEITVDLKGKCQHCPS